MTKNIASVFLALFVTLVVADGFVHAAAVRSRVLYVAKDKVAGNGLTENSPFSTIGDALKKARQGDTIQIGPGLYTEHIAITVPDLTLRGPFTKDNMPLVRVMAPNGGKTPLVTDGQNTLWHAIAFQTGGGGSLADLRGFTGRFEHCYFDLGQELALINIYGGNPVFASSTFAGNQQHLTALEIHGLDGKESSASFGYCLFRDFGGGAVVVRGRQNLDFVNCLFANSTYAVLRPKEKESRISMVNSVFYLGQSAGVVMQSADATKVRVERCLYAPAPGPHFSWKARPLDEQPELAVKNCLAGSPRFKGGRQVYLNLGIDDTRNAAQWKALIPYAQKLGLQLTLSLDSNAITPATWETVIPAADQGNELAAHGATHSSVQARHALHLGYYTDETASATASIDKSKHLRVDVDGKPRVIIGLDENALTLGELVRRLQDAGVNAQLSDMSMRNVPAVMLAEAEPQTILFQAYMPSFILDTEKYISHMLEKPRADIEAGLKNHSATVKTCTSLVFPFSESGPELAQTVYEHGFTVARSGARLPFTSAFEPINLFEIWGASLKGLKTEMPLPDTGEALRLTLDFLKYHGAVMAFYSHGEQEFTASDWYALFELIAKDELIRSMSLGELADLVRDNCEPLDFATYQCRQNSALFTGEPEFEPADDSPLLGAGKPAGFGKNYLGLPVPRNRPPNIGLY